MFQTKRFGLVASRQEYQMLCRAERHMNKIQKKKPTAQRLPAFKERTRKDFECESARSNQNTSKHHRQRSRVFQHGEG